MRRAERIVDVDVARARRAPSRSRRRSSLLRRGSAGSRAARRRRQGALRTARSAAGPTQSSANATGRPSSSLRRAATGRRLISGFGLPFGRPRCDARITHAAPASSAYLIVGSDARMRVSSPMTPLLERDVEVDADEDAPALQIEVANRSFGHGRVQFRVPGSEFATGLAPTIWRSRSTQRLE